MTKPEYLVSYLPYSKNVVNRIHRVIGETEKYRYRIDSVRRKTE